MKHRNPGQFSNNSISNPIYSGGAVKRADEYYALQDVGDDLSGAEHEEVLVIEGDREEFQNRKSFMTI